MRLFTIVGVSLLATAGLAACQKKGEPAKAGEAASVTATAPAPVSMTAPHRKAGLWTQTMSTAGMKQVVKMCLDADTESKMTVWGQQVGKNPCSKNVITPVPGGMKFESECDLGEGGHMVSTGTATGDFNSAYTVKVSSTTTGAQMAQANGSHEMTMEGKYEGACPAGMKGGDMQMSVPGMKQPMTINVEDMQARAAAMKK
jgi:hypothetical protein